MKKSLATDLTQGNVLRQLIAFAIPIALANILQIVYTVVDTVIVGRFIGTDGIAGVSSASNIIMLCTNFSMGISGAGQVIIAQFQGKNDRDAVSRSIGTMFTFTMLVALVLTAVFLPLTRPLLRLIRTPEAAFSMAVSYAANHDLRGIVLLASYPTKAVDEPLLLLYGTEDGVLNRERVAEASHYGSVETRVIEGGNHASFGDYGPQAGDRPAAISAREQQEQTLSAIAAWLDTNK